MKKGAPAPVTLAFDVLACTADLNALVSVNSENIYQAPDKFLKDYVINFCMAKNIAAYLLGKSYLCTR